MQLLQRLFETFHNAGRELYLVGGAVRDLAMGASWESLDDLDFATNALPRESLELLQKAGYRTYDVGIEFGTVGTIIRGPASEGYPKDVQVTTYRSKEKYRRGSRHPVVSFGDSIDEDLCRRDFSINSIAMDAKGDYYDPYDGRGDINRRTLRAVGDPLERLAEDPLRILRIARFMAKLGFEPDAQLEHAAYAKATYLLEIARQRWLQEMNKLVCGPHAAMALEFLARTRALGVILPELVALVGLERRCPAGPSHPDFWAQTLKRVERAGKDRNLSWAALLADVGRPWTRTLEPMSEDVPGPILSGLSQEAYPQEPAQGAVTSFPHHQLMAGLMFKGIARRFHFDNPTSDHVSFVLSHQRAAIGYDAHSWGDAEVRHFVRDMNGEHEAVIAFGKLLGPEEPKAANADLDGLAARIKALGESGQLVPELPKGLGGQFIQQLGLKPGPVLGELIEQIKQDMLDGRLGFGLDVEDYIAHARTLCLGRP